MCIYEYTVTAKFLAIYSYSKLPAVVREEYIFSRGKEMIFPIYQKYVPFLWPHIWYQSVRMKSGGGQEIYFPSEVEEADFWCPLGHGNRWSDGVECPHLLIKFLP